MRERLPDRRSSETIKATITKPGGGALTMYVTTGLYQDGRPGEIFLTGKKTGSELEAVMMDAGILASLALQFGAPIEEIAAALNRQEDGTAASYIGAALDIVANK